MRTAKRHRTTWAVAVSVLAHLAVVTVLLLQKMTLVAPLGESGPPEAIIPILIMPRMPPAASPAVANPSAIRLHQRRLRPDDSPAPVAPLQAPTTFPRPAEPGPPQTTAPAQAAGPAETGPPGPDLRLALRHGLAGCANGGANLSRAERERCEEQLGRGASTAPFMPAAIPARIRTYYDAVAEAKKPDPAPTPQRAPGRLGRFDGDGRATNGHGPGIGCHIAFGVGEKPKAPPHALTLGPCFIEPPKGSLTPEVDLTPP